MKLLLDTHAFIWWDSEPEKLSPSALELCSGTEHSLILSVVSIWEMQIKSKLNKLHLRKPLAQLVEAQRRINSIEILGISLEHVLALDRLPLHHRDPFDRLLVAQALHGDLTVLTADSKIPLYDVDVRW